MNTPTLIIAHSSIYFQQLQKSNGLPLLSLLSTPTTLQEPTWPSACAPSAHALPPRSSTHCGCCPASGPLQQSQPGTGPWSCWCCFLHRSRREGMGTLEHGLGSHSRKSGDSNLTRPEEAVPTLSNTSCSQPSRPRLGETHKKTVRWRWRAEALHIFLARAGSSGAQRAKGLGPGLMSRWRGVRPGRYTME